MLRTPQRNEGDISALLIGAWDPRNGVLGVYTCLAIRKKNRRHGLIHHSISLHPLASEIRHYSYFIPAYNFLLETHLEGTPRHRPASCDIWGSCSFFVGAYAFL